MRIRQRAYFAIYSKELGGDELAQRLGLPADDIGVRGSRLVDPPRPAFHWWEIACDERSLCVDEQIGRVIDRLRPIERKLTDVAASVSAEGEGCGPVMRVVRYLDDADGEEEELPEVQGLHKLPGQHQLLGWHLDIETLAFLARVGAALDVDEYG